MVAQLLVVRDLTGKQLIFDAIASSMPYLIVVKAFLL